MSNHIYEHKVQYYETDQMGIVHHSNKTMTHFGETVQVSMTIPKYNGVILEIKYEVKDKETKETRCTGYSRHCFLDRQGKPISLKKKYAEIDQKMRMLESEKKEEQ